MLENVQYAFMVANYIGIIAFSISGVLAAVRQKLDLIVVFFIAMIASHGGGMIRDVLMNKVPSLLIDPMGFYIVCTVMLITKILGIVKLSNMEKKNWFVISDSIGLVAFGITGALLGIDGGLHFFGVVVMSFLTAVGGGLLRDVLVNQFPNIFRSEFYGSAAIFVGAVLYGFHTFYDINEIVVFGCLIVGLCLRLAAYRYNWQIPRLTDL